MKNMKKQEPLTPIRNCGGEAEGEGGTVSPLFHVVVVVRWWWFLFVLSVVVQGKEMSSTLVRCAAHKRNRQVRKTISQGWHAPPEKIRDGCEDDSCNDPFLFFPKVPHDRTSVVDGFRGDAEHLSDDRTHPVVRNIETMTTPRVRQNSAD